MTRDDQAAIRALDKRKHGWRRITKLLNLDPHEVKAFLDPDYRACVSACLVTPVVKKSLPVVEPEEAAPPLPPMKIPANAVRLLDRDPKKQCPNIVGETHDGEALACGRKVKPGSRWCEECGERLVRRAA